MGNCGSNPKTNESDAPVPEPVAEEVKVEETKPQETADDKSLGTLLNEKGEKEGEEAKEAKEEEPKTEEVAAEEKKEEAKPDATEVAPKAEA